MRDKKIHAFAKTRVARFKNEQGQQITWALRQIIDICPVPEDDKGILPKFIPGILII